MKRLNSVLHKKNLLQSDVIIIDQESDLQNNCCPAKKLKTQQKVKKLQNPYQNIAQVPEIYLTDKNMQDDPIQLFIQLQKKYSQFGGVKIIASQNWNPPFSLRMTERGITTRVQHIHKLKKAKSLLLFLSLISQPFKQKEQAYNIKSFELLANDFKKYYKYRTNPTGTTTQLKNEQEFWNIVEMEQKSNHKYKITIEYAADLPVNKYGSGFPTSLSVRTLNQKFTYHENLFNLNNLYKSPLSLMTMVGTNNEHISGVTIPWMYIGMMFSAFCWHVQDLWLNSVNYSHKGQTKTWYIIPASDKQKFQTFIKQQTGKPQVLDRITFMIDPISLIKAGIKVYKINQRPKQYVLTFLKAYHCGFSHGFNVGQAVNFTSPTSLSTIKSAIKNYQKSIQRKPLVFPYEWLILSNVQQKINFGQLTKIMNEEYEQIICKQYETIKSIKSKYNITSLIEFSKNTKYNKFCCYNCKQYLYLWCVKCKQCLKIYCKKHIQLCCGQYTLMIRELSGFRRKIKSFINSQ